MSLRKLAIKNLQSKETDILVFVEHCYRHYSREYHTPLHIAKEKIPQEEVILIYMEDEMKDFTVEDLEEFKNDICNIDSRRPMIEAPVMTYEEDAILDDEAWIAQQTALLKKQEEKDRKKKEEKKLSNEEIVKKTHDAIRNLTGALGEFQKNVGKKKDK